MRFLVVGLGHCGGKIANDFKKTAIGKKDIIVDVCVINTDEGDLETHKQISSNHKLLIGTGKGAAKNWKEGVHAVEQARTNIHELLVKLLMPDTDVIILTMGEGGGTGSGAAPVVSEIVGELGRTCIAIATLPFEVESVKAKVNAAFGLDLLYQQEALKAIICIDNDKITAHFPDRLLTEAYSKVNELIVGTFLNLIDLAHTPSRADRIDESELASIFNYSGFATLVNFRTPANLVENLSATLRHSWNGSLFAEMDPTTATAAIFGIQAPSHLFTTTQVDSVRKTFRDFLAGGNAMVGIYPLERSRWASYTGILTGMKIPAKIRVLLESAKKEYLEHQDLVEERQRSKKAGLRFDLDLSKPSPVSGKSSARIGDSKNVARIESPLLLRESQAQQEFERIMVLVQRLSGETYSLDELVAHFQDELNIMDERRIHSLILKLQDEGYLAELERNRYKVIWS